jgi:hypothetical protein
LVDCAILAGPEYARNNGIVFNLIQSLTINGPAWPWIQSYQSSRDGRRAWKALVDTVHQLAHQDLQRLGEPIPENRKVRDFLMGIVDPQCATITLNVLSNETYMNSFSKAVNYITSAIDLIARNSTSMSRQVSEYNTSATPSGRSGRGRGRGGCGHPGGRYNGRGGRGGRSHSRGRGRGNTGNNNQQDELTRSYSREEWDALTLQQKAEYIEQEKG